MLTLPARAVKTRMAMAVDELPEGPLRDGFLAFLDEMVDLVQNPRCAERQSDGVPCASVVTSCEECQRTVEVLRRLRSVLAEERG
jgi:hypothetical protein